MVSHLNSLQHPTFFRRTTESSDPSCWRMGFLTSVFTFRCAGYLSCHQYGLLHSAWSSLPRYPLAFLWEWSCKKTDVTEAGIERDGYRKNGEEVMKNVHVTVSDQIVWHLLLQKQLSKPHHCLPNLQSIPFIRKMRVWPYFSDGSPLWELSHPEQFCGQSTGLITRKLS